VGDSRVEWGINPLKVENGLGKNYQLNKCYNLGMPGSNGLDVLKYLNTYKKYPKALIIGYSAYGYLNHNHSFNPPDQKSIFKLSNKIRSFISMSLNKTFLFEDNFESLRLYLSNQKPYFIKHEYDDQGGVKVWENGNYKERKLIQIQEYSEYKKEFDSDKALKFVENLNLLLNKFRSAGTEIILLRMPVCMELKQIEDVEKIEQAFSLVKTDHVLEYYNCNNTSPNSFAKEYIAVLGNLKLEESFFLDGSHISHSQTEEFSRQIGIDINQLLFKKK
jgi:hypothetical protein